MKTVCISDTHNQLGKIKLPEGDLLVHTGDWTMRGNLTEVAQFAYDLRQIVGRFPLGALVVAGNHDFLAEREPATTRMLLQIPGVTYLHDESVTINGIRFWGSPWTPWFHDWAFNLERGKEIQEKWDLIPKDTDVLLTHGPPATILDVIPNGKGVGCMDLLWTLHSVRPKLSVFGHIHHSYGIREYAWDKGGYTQFVNASICTEAYKPTNEPIVIEL
jgi:Icc-related predicted phosphoesterase